MTPLFQMLKKNSNRRRGNRPKLFRDFYPNYRGLRHYLLGVLMEKGKEAQSPVNKGFRAKW
jgi:hypothetical protein